MAGFFGFFDYTKPGKGIDKDAPEKHPFFLFFELVWRKLGRLMLLNVMYAVVLLPLLAAIYYFLYGLLFSMLQQIDAGTLAQLGVDPSDMPGSLFSGLLLGATFSIPPFLRYVLLAASVVLYGPASCGLAFMLRNFARQQHAWNSDFFDKLKQNFKQGLALGLLDLLLLALFVFNITGAGDGALLTAARYGSIALLVIYLFMRNYFFMMAVTFELKLSQLLKNAWIFAVLGLWRNFLVVIVNAALFALAFLFPILELIAVPLLLFSVTGFITVYTCFPIIKKYMLDPKTEPAAEES